ncbi:hypothetical protein ACC848_42190, partial [Rhizobium johnstonii]
ASQAVIGINGGPPAGIDLIDTLKGLSLGAMAGSTSAQTIDEVIQPTGAPRLYASNEDAVAAFNANQFDAFVIDLPTAFLATSMY